MRTKKRLSLLISFIIIVFIFGFYFRGAILNSLTSVFLGQGFSRESVVIDINDVSKQYIDTASVKLPQKSFVHKLSIEAKGEISDTVKINHDIILLPGIIDTCLYNSDWYQSTYTLKYYPNVLTRGNLQLKFTFYYQ